MKFTLNSAYLKYHRGKPEEVSDLPKELQGHKFLIAEALYVPEHLRGYGYGRQCLEAFLRRSAAHGYVVIGDAYPFENDRTLEEHEVEERRNWLMAFYERVGFVEQDNGLILWKGEKHARQNKVSQVDGSAKTAGCCTTRRGRAARIC